MGQSGISPVALARELSRGGRTVTDKAVRNAARSSIARFDKSKHPAYQSHEYTAAEAKVLRGLFAERGTRRKSSQAKAAPKSKRTARKSTRVTAAPSGE